MGLNILNILDGVFALQIYDVKKDINVEIDPAWGKVMLVIL